jgi:hypothetical protein
MLHDPVPVPTRSMRIALDALLNEGLQAPSHPELSAIIRAACQVTFLMWATAISQPTSRDLDEMFCDFVIRCVNRGPGVGDVRIQ